MVIVRQKKRQKCRVQKWHARISIPFKCRYLQKRNDVVSKEEREREKLQVRHPERWREYPRTCTDDDGTNSGKKGYSFSPKYVGRVAIRDIN
jgi:hypothetical protein